MSLVAVVATVRAREGRSGALGAAFRELIAPSRADHGCIEYELHQSTSDPNLWMMYEVWASQADLDAHAATPHLTGFAARVPEFSDEGLDIQTFTPVTREV